MKKMTIFAIFASLTMISFNAHAGNGAINPVEQKCKKAGGELERVGEKGALKTHCCIRAALPPAEGVVKPKPQCEDPKFKVLNYGSDNMAWCCHK